MDLKEDIKDDYEVKQGYRLLQCVISSKIKHGSPRVNFFTL